MPTITRYHVSWVPQGGRSTHGESYDTLDEARAQVARLEAEGATVERRTLSDGTTATILRITMGEAGFEP